MGTAHSLREVIMEGAVQRVRPKMMTVASIMGGLFPIMWTTGTGADVMKRIAAPMIGGMVSSTILTLLVIPMLYALWRGWSVSIGAAPLLTGTDLSLQEQEGLSGSERRHI
jgi:Cu(I)/Ag(I) efflux system membrane protein CusA/SilA